MLEALANVLPAITIKDDQIVHTFTGVRPLPVSKEGATGRISRDHSVDVEPAGRNPFAMLTLIGGKWTTFRVFGEEVADLALAELGKTRSVDTYDLKIGGGRNLPTEAPARAAWVRETAGKTGLTEARFSATGGALWQPRRGRGAVHGGRAGRGALLPAPDYSRRELLFLIEHERVREIGDILLRRTTLGIEGRIDAPLTAEVAALMASAFGWSDDGNIPGRGPLQRNHRAPPPHPESNGDVKCI